MEELWWNYFKMLLTYYFLYVYFFIGISLAFDFSKRKVDSQHQFLHFDTIKNLVRNFFNKKWSNLLVVVLRCILFIAPIPFCWVCWSGRGASPNSAISDMYSSSILALSPGTGGPPWPGRLDRQSRAMWPAAPQLEQTMLLVTLGLSGH